MTVLFLTLYVVINLVAAIEKLVSEPSYRPKIDPPWYLSMLGAVGALFVMYLISPLALIVAVGLELAVYIYFRTKTLQQQWGDVNAGFWMRMARFALLRLNRRVISARNWRPLILVFVKDIDDRIELVKLAAAFGQNKGVLTISQLIFTHDHLALQRRKIIREHMLQNLKSHGLEAFCEVNVVNSLHSGILNVSKGHGIAGIKTNTVMFGWSGDHQSNVSQLRIIRDLGVAGKNILLVKFNDHDSWKIKHHQRIDIWWGGRENNGDLMLILAFMLQLNREWENAQIHIRSVVNTKEEGPLLQKGIEASLAQARIPAEVHIVLKKGEGFTSILHRESAGADIVFLGLKSTKEGEEEKHVAKLETMAGVAKVMVFVQNNSVEDALPILLNVE